MSSVREIREIMQSIRLGLMVGREWGLEPPRLSVDALEYLEGGSRPQKDSSQEIALLQDPPPKAVMQQAPSGLDQLREQIGDCRRCKLWNGRTHLVFGEGSPNAKLVFVGEAPGRDEDIQGRPFVGDAGRLLTDIIEKGFRLKREEVYICNVVKCRPPGNRKPEADEVESCMPFLREQLRIIHPQVICGLGRVAASALTGKECRIPQERGTWASFMGIPFMSTFHPAHILRNPAEERSLKRLVWSDVKQIMARMGLRSES